MGRVLNLVLLAAMLAGAAVTYDMKHKAELAAEKVASLEADIAREKHSISLLKAEWSLLTQPSRLQATVEKYADHFKLQAFAPSQIATVDEIPLKPIGVDSKAAETLARIAAGEHVEIR
jgi:hypothetical protein